MILSCPGSCQNHCLQPIRCPRSYRADEDRLIAIRMRKNIHKCNYYYHYFKLLINDQNTCKQITLHLFIQWSNRRVDWPDNDDRLPNTKIFKNYNRFPKENIFKEMIWWSSILRCTILCDRLAQEPAIKHRCSLLLLDLQRRRGSAATAVIVNNFSSNFPFPQLL